jgi:hypothetical protein
MSHPDFAGMPFDSVFPFIPKKRVRDEVLHCDNRTCNAILREAGIRPIHGFVHLPALLERLSELAKKDVS